MSTATVETNVITAYSETTRFEATKFQKALIALAALGFAIVFVSMGIDSLFNDELALSTTPFVFREAMQAGLALIGAATAALTVSYYRSKK